MKVYFSKDELLALQVNNSSDSNVPSVELANSKEPSAAAVFDISSNESSPLASYGCCSTVNSDLKTRRARAGQILVRHIKEFLRKVFFFDIQNNMFILTNGRFHIRVVNKQTFFEVVKKDLPVSCI